MRRTFTYRCSVGHHHVRRIKRWAVWCINSQDGYRCPLRARLVNA